MATYTTEVRTICESAAGLSEGVGFNSIEKLLSPELVEKVLPLKYPIFDEKYRYVLNKKILTHFFTREICEETVGLWLLRMEERMEEIMPYYNKLYLSELEEIKPFFNVDITKEGNRGYNITKRGDTTNSYTKENTGTSNTAYGEHGNDSRDKSKTGTNTTGFKAGNKHTWETGGENEHDWGTKQDNGSNTHNGTTKRNDKDVKSGTTDTTHTNSDVNRFSDTPQGGLDGMKALRGNMYLTNATLNDGNEHTLTHTNETDKLTGTTTENSTGTAKNKTSTDAKSQKTHNWDRRTEQTVADNTEYKFGENWHENGTHNITDGHRNRTDNLNETKSGGSSSNEDVTNTGTYLEHISGYKGNKTYAELLTEWRKTFLNIDQMIMRDLEDCFFLLW